MTFWHVNKRVGVLTTPGIFIGRRFHHVRKDSKEFMNNEGFSAMFANNSRKKVYHISRYMSDYQCIIHYGVHYERTTIEFNHCIDTSKKRK